TPRVAEWRTASVHELPVVTARSDARRVAISGSIVSPAVVPPGVSRCVLDASAAITFRMRAIDGDAFDPYAASASARSATSASRFAGRGCKHRVATAKRPAGKSGRDAPSGAGLVSRIAASTTPTFSPRNGNDPLSSSYKITPSDHTSLRASMLFW